MKRLLTTLALVFAGFGLALAQRTVTGTVTGDGDALIGASVAVKGAGGGARTDIDGKYSVQVPAGATTLVFFLHRLWNARNYVGRFQRGRCGTGK
jgi:hypothetical protein